MDSSVIHAYNAPPVPLPGALHADTGCPEAPDGWKNRASNLLCCFSSSGYYLHSSSTSPSTISTSAWGTGELCVFAQAAGGKTLLRPQLPCHEGRITLVLDLDGTHLVCLLCSSSPPWSYALAHINYAVHVSLLLTSDDKSV
jgi:hypothetical protein